ncbi:hypothetical protein PsYK624_115360 [Phanerochaete sordida]|uniref:F-box domain-containing protein n=1 Tax=Phanerochaete sordida TaxID=48140 RepID=A0A9P3LIN4_9APHY|nr:hypothetical protein PsYK624_115360 [Phanerochaete sordida]
MNVLPAELLDCVIDEMQDDASSLRACSLVCKAWLPRTSAHLFKSLSAHFSVETYDQPDPWKAPSFGFHAPIISSARVAAHVQVLRITICPSTVADVAAIVVQLPQLRSLSVGGTLMTTAPSLPPPPSSGRHIGYLCVYQACADVIPYFLSLFASVGTLEVHLCHVDDHFIPRTWPPLRHPVQHLHFWNISGNVLRYLTSLLEPSALEGINASLNQTWDPIDLDDLSHLLRIAGSTIRSLEVQPDYRSFDTISDLSSLQECTHLESITIEASWSLLGNDWWRGFLAFLPFLPPATRVVRFVVSLTGGLARLPDIVMQNVDWGMIGSALERCSGLQRLQVGIRSVDTKPLSSPEYRGLREAILVELPSRLQSIAVFD